MSVNIFLGQAPAVAQVWTASIDSVSGTPADNTFTVTIGGVAVSVAGITDVATTATALRAALNASTHPYFSTITWSGTGGNIIGTADVAGEPFVAALTETGAGTGTVTDFAVTVANAGPNDWSTAANWSLGAEPVDTDEVVVDNCAVAIKWGLDNSGMSGSFVFLRIGKGMTGYIGLNRRAFTYNGQEDSSYPEYREDYLKVKTAGLDIGENLGGGSADGSRRIKIDTGTTATTIRVYGSAASGETGLPPIRLQTNHNTTDLFIFSGHVGLAIDAQDEVSSTRKVSVVGGKFECGYGLTVITFEQLNGGPSVLRLDATITTITVAGGVVTHDGSAAATNVNVKGGRFDSNSTGTITNLTMTGGVTDFTRNTQARTVTTPTLDPGAELIYDPAVVTLTNKPTSTKRVSLKAA